MKLKELYAIFRKSPEGKWILGETEATTLYKLILKHKPQTVLDLGLGIGCSTATMALAMESGRIIALEQKEKCIRLAKSYIPPLLQTKIDIVLSEVGVFQHKKISKYLYFAGYRQLPYDRGPFDFVVVDGPGMWLQDGELIQLPSGDIINLLPHLACGCRVLVDGKKSSVELYRRYLSPYLQLVYKHKKYTIFERTAKSIARLDEIEIVNRTLVKYREHHYFSDQLSGAGGRQNTPAD